MSEPELHQLSLRELSGRIARRELSSRELLDHQLARIAAVNPTVNAVVTLDEERARAGAAAADDDLANGRSHGALHGIPVTIKDALAVAGMRATGGATELRDHVATTDADVVAAVRAQGAIVMGKTNVPRWSGDLQTFNDIFGTTTNPWDTTRAPGGSSGGAACSVALGFTPFEIGTDIGGSIRIPSAWCGVVGHKPSFGLVPTGGYLDRVQYGTTEPDVNVHGPIARSVPDLELLLGMVAHPWPDRAVAVRHQLPPARHDRIDGYRVAVWSHDDACPPSAATVAAVDQAGDVLASLGATVQRDARPAIDADAALRLGLLLVGTATTPSIDPEAMARFQRTVADPTVPDEVKQGLAAMTLSHYDWQQADMERTRIRARWHEFFGGVDALVCPVIVTPPIPHTQDGGLRDRTITVDGVTRPYIDLIWWTILIGMAYLPATVVPVATDADGLPVSVQVVGPYMEDRTCLAVAGALRDALGPIALPDRPR